MSNSEVLLEILPDEGNRFYYLKLDGIQDAVHDAGGVLRGTLWTVDAAKARELKELAEDEGFEVRVH